MRRGVLFLLTILVLLGIFYLGVLYERNDCRIDVPDTAQSVDNTVRCRDFRSNIDVPVTTAPPP